MCISRPSGAPGRLSASPSALVAYDGFAPRDPATSSAVQGDITVQAKRVFDNGVDPIPQTPLTCPCRTALLTFDLPGSTAPKGCAPDQLLTSLR